MSLVLVIDKVGEQAPWINQTLRRAGHEVILSAEMPTGSLAGLLRPAAVLVNLEGDCDPDVKPIEMIRRLYPTAALIALSGCTTYETAVACMRAGAVDCLALPVEPQELVQALDRTLSRGQRRGYRAMEGTSLLNDERYKLLAEVSNEGIWALDVNQGTIFINNRMGEMLGYSLDEMMGRAAVDFMHPDELEKQRQRIANRTTGQIERYECCFLRKDGSRLYLIVSASPLYDRMNKFIGSIAICTDITERKLMENQLVVKEAKFRTVIEQLSEGFLLVDENGIVMEWNQAEEKITGIPATEAIGKSLRSIMLGLSFPEGNVPERMDDISEMINARLKTGRGILFDHPIEYSIMTSDGSLRNMEQTIFPIQTGEGLRVGAITRDVTQTRQFINAIQENEERYRSLVETSPDGIMLTDMSGAMLSCNQRAADILGYDHPAELIGKNILRLIAPGERRRALENYNKVLVEGGIRDVEFPLARRDGREMIGEVSTNLVRDANGEPRFIMGIVRDITARKHNEQELRRLNRALRATSACNQALVRAADELELFNEICNTIVVEGEYKFAWVALFVDAQEVLLPVAWYKKENSRLAEMLCRAENHEYGGPLSAAIAMRQPVVVENVALASYNQTWVASLRESELASMAALPLHYEGFAYGALLIYGNEPGAFDDNEMSLLNEMAADLSYGIHTLQVRTDRRVAWNLLEQSKSDLEKAYDATLEGWSRALELRERETAGHSKRVVQMTVDMSLALGACDGNCIHVRRGALLHDIGKMAIPDAVLLKPGPLSADEWVIMRQHPNYAYQLLKDITYLQQALEIPYNHHERWDGSGYPRGLKGEQIPIAARIFAVIDVWDALTSARPYRAAWPEKQALDYIREQAGISFDPRVVDAFLKIDLAKYRDLPD